LPETLSPDARSQARLGRAARLARAHLRNGWLGLLVFVCFGLALESLHAWKSAAYLGPGQEVRRLQWTLAHAHGIGLSLLQIAFAATLQMRAQAASRLTPASRLLDAATLLIPGGFLLGGLAPYEGDPGIGVWLVPLGAALLLVAVARVAWVTARDR
jgi:hypothetical protein